MKIYYFLIYILTLVFATSAYANERASELSKCRLSIKEYIQSGKNYKMTLFIYDKKNDSEYIFKKRLKFILPLNNHSYNYIKKAYLLHRKLCIEYYENNNNEYIIKRMFDDYLIND